MRAEERVRQCFDAIQARDDDVRAWTFLDQAGALAQARERDAEAPRGPLHGVPVGVKDVIDTAAMPTAYGSPIYEGQQPARDAACVVWLREQGAIVLGKTVTTEFATYQPPVTRNPHDPERTPGGSSSGSAAAVAAGMAPVAYGTQTAGSVIRPASFCGVVGFKPRHGWASMDGVKRLSERLDTLGTFGRTVADAARLAGFEVPEGDVRLAWCRTPWGEDPPQVAEAAAHVGAEELELPAEFAGLVAAQEALMAHDVARNLAPEYDEHRNLLSDVLREYIEGGQQVGDDRAEEAVALAAAARAAWPAGADALLVPAAPGEAPLRSEGSTGDPVYCRAWTLLGVPAISVPGLTGPNGLPVGVQVVGLDEAAVLGAAARLEAALA
jgi:Asp-tRNA(Asn)/Glu-tRNA(Gln) amidotransferase A subunit family amidase